LDIEPSIIKFCVRIGKTPAETIGMRKTCYNLKKFGYKKHKSFTNGRKSVKDDKREGRPLIVIPSV